MKHAIAFSAWWALAAAFLPSSAAASAPEPSPWCLPPESGRQLRTVVESETVRAVLGEAFRLEHADIQGTLIDLEIQGEAGEFAKAKLRPARPEPAAGRWFGLFAEESSSPRAAGVLEKLAATIDAGFAANPFVPCQRERPRQGIPRGWFVLFGLIQWLLIGVGLAAAFRRPAEDRRD